MAFEKRRLAVHRFCMALLQLANYCIGLVGKGKHAQTSQQYFIAPVFFCAGVPPNGLIRSRLVDYGNDWIGLIGRMETVSHSSL